jgi:hypothetical protein
MLEAVSVHETPVPVRSVSVVPHHVQVEGVVHPVDRGRPAEVAKLLIVILVGSEVEIQLIKRECKYCFKCLQSDLVKIVS